jgi:hypothetical protein
MTLRRNLLIAALTVTGMAAGFVSTARADDTETTFTLDGGELTMTVAATATLTDADTGTLVISGSLGAVAVSDLRGGTAEWNVTVVSSAFTGVLGSSSTSVSYTAGAVAESGTTTVADGAATVVNTPSSVVAPTSLSGNNTASWNPTLDVTMPAGALADDYAGTVTTSVL